MIRIGIRTAIGRGTEAGIGIGIGTETATEKRAETVIGKKVETRTGKKVETETGTGRGIETEIVTGTVGNGVREGTGIEMTMTITGVETMTGKIIKLLCF